MPRRLLIAFCLLLVPSLVSAQRSARRPAQQDTTAAPQTFKKVYQPPLDLSKDPVLYLIGYSHLDTEWRWDYPQVIREFLPKTLHDNFDLFQKYPNYLFNWTGSNRYRLIKEYYPADYQKLKQYVVEGRWFPAGSNVEEGDVNSPSEESIIRQILYGNQFFRRELGIASNEFMIPDCFGFPASLPSIFAHCGLKGFSTQKLTWGSAVDIPFNVGLWVGPDGQSVEAALNPGSYGSRITDDMSQDTSWYDRVEEEGHKYGVYADFHYYGTGDTGGAPDENSVRWMERSLIGGGPLNIRSARASDLFNDITPDERARLPRYQGDLELTQHSAGSLTSESEQKRWNHKNELLADATERASIAADWLGAAPYDHARISDAWLRFLPGQFHDIMAGTAIPKAYEYSWNDQVLAMNEFSGVLQEAVGGVARGLDTRVQGVPVVVYNPLSIARQDLVTAQVTFPGHVPAAVRVYGPDGREVPSQVNARSGSALEVLFLAQAPSVGFVVYDVRPAEQKGRRGEGEKGSNPTSDGREEGSGKKESTSQISILKSQFSSGMGLENGRYRVRLDRNGDIASLYDKAAHRELLSAPARLAFQYENPTQYPAWNMDWADQSKPPCGYVEGPATVRVVENGPARVALQVERSAQGSRFIQTIRLAAGDAGNRVEIANTIDWQSRECALKAVFPLTVSNPEATYNWELGTIRRGNNDPKKYEVASHKWFDLTDTSGGYGVSVLDECKYGSDKPDDHTLRLTLLYTPGVRGGYPDQATQDWGRHQFAYALEGHAGDWRKGQTQWEAARFNQPLLAFQPPPHPGALGRSFSLLHLNTPQVSVEALKQAEESREVIVRFNELAGKPAASVRLSLAAPILSAREVNGQEQPLGNATVQNGQLVFSMSPYRPRAFALTLGAPPVRLTPPHSEPLPLPYNANVVRSAPDQVSETASSSAGGNTGGHEVAFAYHRSAAPAAMHGDFDGHGDAIPAELLPTTLNCDGILFHLGKADQNNSVVCRGQALRLPSGSGRRVYLLAAAAGGDTPATFQVDGKPVTLTICSWDGYIGQWDNRLWSSQNATTAYSARNWPVGLVPGYIKRDRVGWYADHKRLADGSNDPYAFCYLFRYEIPVPDGAQTLRLPDNSRVRVLAATVAQDPNANTRPAQPLYDTLTYHLPNDNDAGTPNIVPVMQPRSDVQVTSGIYRANSDHAANSSATYHDAIQVSLTPPLYHAGPLRYTLDGTQPGPNSPVYTQPFWLTRTATIKVAAPEEDGRIGPVRSERIIINDTTPPTIRSVSSVVGMREINIRFSEPVDRASAQDPANYRLPDARIASAKLAEDNLTVMLSLDMPLVADTISKLAVVGVRDASGNAISPDTSVAVDVIRPVFQLPDTLSFDGTGPGVTKSGLEGLPTAGSAAWTMNLFLYMDRPPESFTRIAGLGEGGRRFGSQRVLGYFRDGIGFFGGSGAVSTGQPFDVGKWQMITITYDGQTVTVYKNGQEIVSEAATMTDVAPVVSLAPAAAPSAFRAGRSFVGQIRDFTVWNRALDAASIQSLAIHE